SYFAPKGHYSADSNYFYGPPQTPNNGPSIFSSPPLHAVRSTPSTPNGIYTYSSTSAFPTSSYQASHYWLAPVFVQTTATVPGAPTNVAATAGNASAAVSCTAPSNGRSPITTYA